MHYQLVAKAADFTPEELQKKTSVHFDNFEFKGIGRYKDVRAPFLSGRNDFEQSIIIS